MNLLNQELKAIQNSITYCKKEYEKEKDPHIREKIMHYLEGLKKEETRILDELNLRLDDIILTDEKPPLEEEEE